MSLRLQIDPGGEKFFSFAKQKLAQAKAWMKRAKLGSITKHFKIADSDIWVNSISVGHGVFLDWIRITAGGGGFVVYPRMRRISDNVTAAATNPGLLDFSGASISTPFGAFILVGPPYRNSGDRVMVTAGSLGGYYDRGELVETTALTATTRMPFVHNYTVDASPTAVVLSVTPHASNPSMTVLATGVSIPMAGSNEVHDVSPDGQKMVSLIDDTRTDFTVDYAAAPVVTEVPTTLDGYGTNTTRNAVFATDNNMNGEAQFQLTEVSESVSFPVCYGYSAANERVAITWDQVYTLAERWDLNTLRTITSPGNGFTNSDGSFSYVSQKTVTLVMPNGVTRSFVAEAETTLATGHYENTFAGGSIATYSGSASGTASRQTIDVEILYVDASLPAVVYRATYKATSFVPDVTVSTTEVTLAEPAGTQMTTHTEVIALVGDMAYEIHRTTPQEVTNDLVATFYANPIAGFFSYLLGNSDSTNATPVDYTTISPPDARQQSTTLGISIKDSERLVWDYQVGSNEHKQGGVGDPRQALLDYLPAVVAASSMSEVNKTLFLADLEAGNLSGYDISLSHTSAPGLGLI